MPASESNQPDIGSVILRQITDDPRIPRENSTTSLWQVPGHPEVASIQSSSLPGKVDYLIVGSGVAACGVTKSLLTNSKSGSSSVAVFEARGLCSGATGRNGGQLTRLPPTRHAFMVENFGLEQANKVMRLTVKGLDAMHDLAESRGPEVVKGVRKTRLEKFFAYYDQKSWDETVEAIKLFEREITEEKGVYELVSKEDTAKIYNLNGAHGGLKFPAGVISPYNLVTSTFKALLDEFSGRLTIDTHTPILDVNFDAQERSGHPYTVKTSRGIVQAANVIYCMNGYTGHLLPRLRGKMYPRRGTMSVQSPGSSFPKMGEKQSWSFYFSPEHDKRVGDVETGRYYGFQNKDTGDLWIGGDRDSIDGFISSDDSKVDVHAEKNLRKIIPKLFSSNWVKGDDKVKRIWTGIMCYTGDQLPLVGQLSSSITGRAGSTGEWIAGGWNTYGMTNGLICGDALGKMILGDDVTPWFPEAYLPTEERLNREDFKIKTVVRNFFDRIGATDLARAKL